MVTLTYFMAASSAPALELNTIIFKHVFWYKQQISGERLQDHWSSGYYEGVTSYPHSLVFDSDHQNFQTSIT